MPGRRTPRQPASTQLHQHTRAAFLGGMDGSALIPYPVGLRSEQSSSKTDGKKLLFWQDTFTGDGTKRTFALTFRPMPYSERMFVNGLYRREGVGLYWRRDDNKTNAQATFAWPPAAGARVVVEYAYYEQLPSTPEYGCIGTPMIYPIVTLPDTATITLIGSDTGAHPERLTYTPTADGMPASLTPEGKSWHGGFGSNDNYSNGPAYQFYAGPSIAPGYTHSWATGPVNFKTQHGHDLSLWGGETEPRWYTASYLRYSLWAKLTNYKKALPTDPTGGASHDIFMSLDTQYLAYNMHYNPHTSTWNVNAYAYQWGDPDGDFSEVASSITVDPYDLAPHRYEIAMDVASSTVTFTVDSQSWSITDPLLWPQSEQWENYPMTPEYARGYNPAITGGFFAGSFGSLGGQYAILRTAGETVETDVVWCTWTAVVPT